MREVMTPEAVSPENGVGNLNLDCGWSLLRTLLVTRSRFLDSWRSCHEGMCSLAWRGTLLSGKYNHCLCHCVNSRNCQRKGTRQCEAVPK